MKVTFKKDFPHSEDGVNITTYKAGETYEVSDHTALVVINQEKVAEKTDAKPPKVAEDKKNGGDKKGGEAK
jgi:hypothetical protein